MSSPIESAARLRRALERSAEAMANARLDDLLVAGEDIDVALGQIPGAPLEPVSDPARLRADIDAARVALMRCRRLGLSLSDFVRVTIDTHGVVAGYDPSAGAAALLAGRGVNTSG